MSGLSFHFYCGTAGGSVNFTDEEWNQLIDRAGKMQELIDRHWAAAVSYGLAEQREACHRRVGLLAS